MIETQKQYDVFAIVVTYNRLAFLKQTLEALRAQLYKVRQIIVVNNNSTDGTKEWLDQQSGLQMIHQANVGGAGGFHTGVKAAYEADAEWVWMMDDDVVPDVDCLQKLMFFTSQTDCLHPLRVDETGAVQDEERWLDPSTCKISSLVNHSYENGKNIWFRNIGSFEGMLIRKNIVEKIGFPDPRFFITHDDLVYGYLASRITNVAVVRDAIIRKLSVNKSEESLYSYLYYYHRNLWIVREYLEKFVPGFEGYRRRRITFQFLYAVYKIFSFNEYPNKVKALKHLYKGYKDYKRRKYGKSL